MSELDSHAATPVRILVAEDDAEMLELLARVLREEGYRVLTAGDGHQALARIEEGDFDLVLSDVRMPGPDGMEVLRRAMASRLHQPVILMTAFGSISSAVEAMRAGAFHYLTKPFSLDELLEIVNGAATQIRQLRAIHAEGGDAAFPIVFRSPAMARLLAMAGEVAPSTASVLITGASGTGKELLARAIHAVSGRAQRPFVPVDCGAIPEGLVESELFGHRRGAFTGSVADKSGIVEEADGGTLFLDEVGNLPSSMQAKLLRFLQDRRFRRVGDTLERAVDVRVVAASNRDLRELVAEGGFREDLYYRLAVISLAIPPLKERRDDIPPLVYHFIRQFNAGAGYTVEGVRPDALDLLVDYAWPGNVRQLENVIERAVILRKAGLVQPSDLPPEIGDAAARDTSRSLDELERQHILQLLEECGGNRSRVAKILGISRRTVYRKLRQYGIDPES
ncbi:MAG TPA: sigma-54 dependent transcriptional regulator [Thermoanaerobaculales bacterium]|nr:sigma-54 dependent transcriptional regulator [Thermoanaerobaculales bacterium]HQN96610.1 sigma-54 dependent transcriptional regulator [Thermoanaerobaculales bacterium]